MPRMILLFASLAAVVLAAGALLLAGSGAPSTAPSPLTSAPPGGLVATPSASISPQSPGPSPTATPYPLADGEPWIVLGGDDGATLVRPDGSGQHGILGGLGVTVTGPTWSPDGKRLVFEGNGDRGSQLWIANVDGSDAQQVTATPGGCPLDTCTEATQPAWSPDGRTIAYIAPTHVGGVFKEIALMTLDVASGATTPIYTTSDATIDHPSWSPDGRSLAFGISRYRQSVSVGRPDETVIAVIDLDAPDTSPKEITEPALPAGYPSWHPTDDLILFRTNPYDDNTKTFLDPTQPSNLFTIRPDGSELAAVTDNAVGGAIVRGPSWTPDGRILFGKLADATRPEELRIIDATGDGEASATGDVITEGEGRWRPGT